MATDKAAAMVRTAALQAEQAAAIRQTKGERKQNQSCSNPAVCVCVCVHVCCDIDYSLTICNAQNHNTQLL